MLTRLAQYPFYSGVSIAYVAIQRNLTAMLAGPKFVAPPQRSGTHTQRSGTLGFGHFSNLVLVVGSAQTLRVYNAIAIAIAIEIEIEISKSIAIAIPIAIAIWIFAHLTNREMPNRHSPSGLWAG
jgi:hypothetical protein